MLKKKNNNKGFSLIQTLVVIGIISVLWTVVIELLNQVQKSQYEILMKSTVLSVKNSLLANLSSSSAWQKTVSLQPSLKCTNNVSPYCDGAPASKDIVVYDSAGSVIFDSTSPSNGFTVNGVKCSTFDPVNGNDSCPIGVKVRWRALCDNSLCQSQQDLLSLQFEYKPQNSFRNVAFNSYNYNQIETPRNSMAGNETPLLSCAKLGKIFIGEGQSFNSFIADTQGCVPYQAFQGPRGEQGLVGAAGPQGVTGPQGNPGPPGAYS